MKAVKKGTTSWRESDFISPDEVESTGTFIYAPDGVTALMVWDEGLQNVRPMNQSELDAFAAAKAQSAADEADRLVQLAAAKNAAAALQTIIDGIDAATLTQAKGAIKQLAQILKGTIRAVVGK